MRSLSIEDIKRIQKDILQVFATYCNQMGLRYFLAYGTLIGAIRHKGYIPWDDDIDVIMPRPDYEVFISNYKDERYQVFCLSNSKDCPFPYAKLYDSKTIIREHTDISYKIGLNIDIFVLDGLPEDLSLARKHIRKCSFWINILEAKKISLSRNRKLIRNAVLLLLKTLVSPIPFSWCMEHLVSLNKKYPFESFPYCSDLCYTDALHIDKRVFEDGCKCDFEGNSYPIPLGYDKWLKDVYGDYMKLPPVEKRVTHHAYEAYMK